MEALGRASWDGEVTEPAVCTSAHAGWSAGWVAQLEKTENPAKPNRNFLTWNKSNCSRAGNGCKVYHHLADGIYECESVVRSYESARFYLKITDGVIVEIERDSAFAAVAELTLDEYRTALSKAAAERNAQLTRQAEDAHIRNAVRGLPRLTGSDKQVRWAEQIRDKAAADLNGLAEKNQTLKPIIEKILSRPSAGWWIDCRGFSAAKLVELSGGAK